jgi:hypothetical protein
VYQDMLHVTTPPSPPGEHSIMRSSTISVPRQILLGIRSGADKSVAFPISYFPWRTL